MERQLLKQKFINNYHGCKFTLADKEEDCVININLRKLFPTEFKKVKAITGNWYCLWIWSYAMNEDIRVDLETNSLNNRKIIINNLNNLIKIHNDVYPTTAKVNWGNVEEYVDEIIDYIKNQHNDWYETYFGVNN